MKLKLVKLNDTYKTQLFDMLEEWYETGEKIIPYTIKNINYHDLDNYKNNLEVKDNIGSAKSIINNGGVLENEIKVDGVTEQRYWASTKDI